MIQTITKRDGRTVPFDIQKISSAIHKAFAGSHNPQSEATCLALAQQVVELLPTTSPAVEEIQDAVEQVLMQAGYVRTAKAFILYRAERSRAREMNTRLMRLYEDITFKPASDSNIKRENANIDADTAMGTMLKYGSEGAKQFYDMFVLNPLHARAHREGDIHIHDLDFYALTTTCTQIDLIQLFAGGFSTGHGVLREPNDIASYAALACIAIQSNQNDQHGGQSVVNFDYAMALGVRKTYVKRYRENLAMALELISGLEGSDAAAAAITQALVQLGLTPAMVQSDAFVAAETQALLEAGVAQADLPRLREFVRRRSLAQLDKITYQSMEALIHNLNTMHSRAGAQTPFSSINYGMDTTPEAQLVVKNLLLATQAGLGHGETPIFPIQIFRVKKGVNLDPGDPNYPLFQLACRVSAKRLFPNFSFQDAPFNAKYYKEGHPETEIAYMGCRTRVIGNVYDPDSEISNGRGNLSFTSINLPRLAIRANRDVGRFFEDLDRMLDLVLQQLTERFAIQAQKRVYNYPFLMGQGVWLGSEKLDWEDTVGEVLKHGTFSVGFIGLAEALTALVGQHHGQSQTSQNLGLEIVGHMRARLDDHSQNTRLNFTLLATPAEGLSGRFVAIDRKRFGEIPGVTDKEYYTNSFHIPVGFPINAFDKLRLEAPYHALTNAGHITYVELDGDPSDNPAAFEKIVRAMADAGIGYGSINHPVDRDPVCGYSGVIGDTCPACGRQEGDIPFDRIRRITGYLVGNLSRFNDAKRAEERDRVKHAL